MANKTLYISEEAQPIWDRVTTACAGSGVSLSFLVTLLLAKHAYESLANLLSVYCPICDEPIETIWEYCGFCGAKLGAANSTVQDLPPSELTLPDTASQTT